MVDDFTLAVATAPKKNSKTWKNGVVSWSELRAWCESPANQKEAGNYVLGRLEGDGRRNNRTVVARSALTLDIDHPDGEFIYRLQSLPYLYLWHTTYSSTPDEPRYRLIIPLDREITPAEYEAAARGIMEELGYESFDPGSVEYARYMFKPSAQKAAWFEWGDSEEPMAHAEDLIALAPESLAHLPAIKPGRNKRDPLGIEGLVGEFNRAYQDLDELIEKYDLPYEPAQGENRWTLKGAIGSAAGVGQVAPGLWYSHHGGDPAHGQACSAFDLVRLHAFGDLDENVKDGTPVNRRPSHQAMLDLAMDDDQVKLSTFSAITEDFGEPTAPASDTDPMDDSEEASETPPDWRTRLQINKAGSVVDSLGNWELIKDNDPDFQALVRNDMTNSIEIDRDLSWRRYRENDRSWTDADLRRLKVAVEKRYKLRAAKERVEDMVILASFERSIDPVVDYLKSLDGKWDGTPRLEESLPGVVPTDFTRLAARKSLVAAVARAMDPGVKWDHTLIFFGNEGLGKSEWINRMSKGWTTDLGDIRRPDTLLKISRTWIVVSDEGHSLKKADADEQKEFLTRRVDVFRAPYERQVADHPRRCVIWGSTNDDVFLRNQQGNRRFLIVKSETKTDLDALTDDYVDQVWAEAYHLWQQGERLYLTDEESALATTEREYFTEDDSLAGQIHEFLQMNVPGNWQKMTRYERRDYYESYDEKGITGGETIQHTCPRQIWYEMLGEQRNPAHADLRLIRDSLKNVPGWRRIEGEHAHVYYGTHGMQRSYERFDVEAELEELI